MSDRILFYLETEAITNVSYIRNILFKKYFNLRRTFAEQAETGNTP
jgi:hypothetical protein